METEKETGRDREDKEREGWRRGREGEGRLEEGKRRRGTVGGGEEKEWEGWRRGREGGAGRGGKVSEMYRVTSVLWFLLCERITGPHALDRPLKRN